MSQRGVSGRKVGSEKPLKVSFTIGRVNAGKDYMVDGGMCTVGSFEDAGSGVG